jgi:hypothetical protein
MFAGAHDRSANRNVLRDIVPGSFELKMTSGSRFVHTISLENGKQTRLLECCNFACCFRF